MSEDEIVKSGERPADRDEQMAGLGPALAALALASGGRVVAVDLMDQADRKAVHQGLVAVGGLESISIGDDAYRRLVARPSNKKDDSEKG